jgi:Tetratricopeptide repeat
LIERESVVDERDLSITNDAIRLHRLVREIAGARREDEVREGMRSAIIAALAQVYPEDAYGNPASWPRCVLLTPHVLASCKTQQADRAANVECANLLIRAGNYFHGRAAYSEGRSLFERALAIREKVLGPEHPDTATSLNNLALLLKNHGELATLPRPTISSTKPRQAARSSKSREARSNRASPGALLRWPWALSIEPFSCDTPGLLRVGVMP